MESRDAELRRRETALAARAHQLRAWEQRLDAREGELSARRSRWSVAWRAALAPMRVLEVILGAWLGVGAVALGGSVLVASAVVCGLLLVLTGSRCLSLPAGAAPPHRGVAARLRSRLARATASPRSVDQAR